MKNFIKTICISAFMFILTGCGENSKTDNIIETKTLNDNSTLLDSPTLPDTNSIPQEQLVNR